MEKSEAIEIANRIVSEGEGQFYPPRVKFEREELRDAIVEALLDAAEAGRASATEDVQEVADRYT